MNKTTLVLGASINPNRYANIAIKRLIDKDVPVLAIGSRRGRVLDVTIETEKIIFKNVDTVTLYLNPEHQKEYYDYIISLKPRRVIFNPGTENKEFSDKLKDNGIAFIEACTLVLLSTNQY
ncbi:CoA-binding protein [Tenacibaculum sp.]|uniref:CoA-binding protein n=1 Tax=Tenacibaculum sp. TaxID=1906242 RepID=UPI003D1391FF